MDLLNFWIIRYTVMILAISYFSPLRGLAINLSFFNSTILAITRRFLAINWRLPMVDRHSCMDNTASYSTQQDITDVGADTSYAIIIRTVRAHVA